MDRDQFVTRILETVQRDLKAKRGEIARVLRVIGLDESYLRSVRRPQHRGAVKLETLGSLLEEAGLEPGAFFARAFPHGQRPSARFRDQARRLESEVEIPATLRAVRENVAAGALLDAEPNTGRDELKVIDALRQTDPVRSGKQAAAYARRVAERPAVARALGIWASALRVRNHHKLAAVVLGEALELAMGHRALVARLIQRASYIVSDRAQFHEAAALVEEALVMFTMDGDDAAVGRVLVDMGRCLYQCGKEQEAIKVFESALQKLPREDVANRFAALQTSSVIQHSVGHLKSAESFAREAEKFRPPGLDGARLAWVQARISQSRGRLESAIRYYENAIAELAVSPADQVVASAELVALHLESGNSLEAIISAKAMAPLVLVFENERTQAVLAALVWAAHAGSITLEFARQTVARLKKVTASGAPSPNSN